MIRDLPLLAILPVDKLLLHEHHDQQRSPDLIKSIEQSTVLRNPPIVVPLRDRTGRYLVLDGAHRSLVFKELEIPHILAQVVEPDDPGLDLNPWNHVIWEYETQAFIENIRAIPNLELEAKDHPDARQELQEKQALALLRLPDGETLAAYPPSNDLVTRVDLLNKVVDTYTNRGRLDRTGLGEMEALIKLYPQLTGLVILPRFRVEDVLYLAGVDRLLPAGSTRFTIAPRALHVNYPLKELRAEKSLEEKDAALQDWLQERVASKSVRYYAEPTYLYDE